MTRSATHEHRDTTLFGLWLFIMSDCLVFASLFATYAVLQHKSAAGPTPRDIFDLSFVLIETIVLLASSLTSGLALVSAQRSSRHRTLIWLGITALLGLTFITMEFREFAQIIAEGSSWRSSAFLSAFFALVGTHGAHVLSGLVWLTVLVALIGIRGLTESTITRIACFSLFWHFLDIIWIFIFSFVYILPLL